MGFVIVLGLDNELPMMVWADVTVMYPHDHIINLNGRSVRASESRVRQLVDRAIKDVRRALNRGKARDYVAFRDLVVQRLCEQYGFVFVPSAKRTIISEEVNDRILDPRPSLRSV